MTRARTALHAVTMGVLTGLFLVPGGARADEPNVAVRGAPPTIAAPVTDHPRRFFSVPGGGVYAQMPDHTIRAIPSGEEVFAIKDEGGGRVTDAVCAASEGPRFACLYTSSASGKGQGGRVSIGYTDSEGHDRSIGSGSSSDYTPTALGVYLPASGDALYAYEETITRNNQSQTTRHVVIDGERTKVDLDLGDLVSRLANIGGGDRADAPVQFVEVGGEPWMIHRRDQAIVAHPARPPWGEPVEIAASSLHDIRAVTGKDGVVYVFYHDPRSGGTRVATSRDGKKWPYAILDGRESGWQIDAAAADDGVHAVFYYFKNSYNKGLRAVTMQDGKQVGDTVTIVREHAFNTGWHPHLGVASDGTTWLSYLRNVEEKERVWSRFASPGDLEKAAIAGGAGWEEDYKDYFLQTGAGAWLTWWNLADGVPDAQDLGGLALGETTYSVDKAILATASLEARYGSFDLGLSYAQAVVDDAVKKLDDGSGVLSGSIKIDELLPGHDMKLGFVWGRYRGTATRGAGIRGDREMDLSTNYIDTRLLALNKWRVHYGVAFTKYEVPAIVHAWSSAAGSTSYAYEGSFFRNVGYTDVDLVLGYSKLDYAAKYENDYNGVVVDGSVAGGISLLAWDAIPTTEGALEDGFTFHLRFQAMLGWLYFHRFESLRGFGFYLRPAYTGELGFTGTTGAPSPRESGDASKDAATLGRTSLRSIRHGPWFDLGVVW